MTGARSIGHPATSDITLDAVLAALADPTRRRIAHQLTHGHADQACISFDLPVSKSTSTHHFRVLREAGLIEQRYSGTAILNTLRSETIEQLFPGLLGAVLGTDTLA